MQTSMILWVEDRFRRRGACKETMAPFFLVISKGIDKKNHINLSFLGERVWLVGCAQLQSISFPFSEGSGSAPVKDCVRKLIINDSDVWCSLPRVFCVDFFALLFSVLWLEVETQQCGRRVTVVGCQNGYVKVAVTDLTGGPSMIVIIGSRGVQYLTVFWAKFTCI